MTLLTCLILVNLNTVIPAIESFLESSLSVIRATSPILLDRDCVGGFFVPIEDVVQCVHQCAVQTMCGPIAIPNSHLKRCVECSGAYSQCVTKPGSVDGSGVPDTDFIIYVSADCTAVPSGVLGFASACQLESELDRPIAGFVNFCPDPFASFDDEANIRVGIHEVIHALAFSSALYPWFRDESGSPRTSRDRFGFPNSRFASTTTVRTATYNDWSTRNGVTSHEVTHLVTPNALEQARLHFNCPNDIIGIELENQGGSGTASSHWEQRIMGNEGMTGFVLFTTPFSRITFGLLQDSGWYMPNYDMAHDLAWGKNTGCTIPNGSCREYISQQQASGRSISPYCDEVNDRTRGCTVDHEYISTCNLRRNANPPSQFQYFDAGASYGGNHPNADFCPFESSRIRCTDSSNSPNVNNAGQFYGAHSRCFKLGSDWTRTEGSRTRKYTRDAGCYQYNCTSSGVEIILEGVPFQCSCEGEKIVVDTTVNGVRYRGSYICPSCASVCYDDLSSCPATEPSPCHGQTNILDPCLPHPCDSYAVCTRDSPLNSDFTCTCTPPFEGDGFNCSIPDPCLSQPCDSNAVCTRDSPLNSDFTCAGNLTTVDLSLQFINDSPRVNGNLMEAELSIGASFTSVTCRINRRQPQDCSSGVTSASFPLRRRNPLTLTVTGSTSSGDTTEIRRSFRIETTHCWLHLINTGITVNEDSVFVEWQATGPSQEQRNTQFECALDNLQTETCTTLEGFSRAGLHVGKHRLQVTPINPECTREVSKVFTFEITAA